MQRIPQLNANDHRSNQHGERGAALVTMLLVSILLLGAGGALIMTTMMSANNTIGAAPEMQAFYIAEAGMQSALNVLRGNTEPLVTATDRISFRTVLVPGISNGPDNNGVSRLAGWLPYNDRFDPASLVPITVGTATGGYRVTIEDMDQDSHIVEFSTSGIIDGSDAATSYQRTYNPGGISEVTIRYAGQSATTLTPDHDTYPLTVDSVLGSFEIVRPLTSIQNNVSIPQTSFELTVNQTRPWAATTVFEGTFQGKVDEDASSVQVTFRKASVKADGTNYSLNLPAGGLVLNLNYSTSPTSTSIPARVSSPDPRRLLIKSYGFGPQGAEKRLQLMVTRAYLEVDAPAAVTLRGADDCTPLSLDSGSSGAKYYSGADYSGVDPQRPAFAVSPCDEDDADAGIVKHDTVADPEIGVMVDDVTGGNEVPRPGFMKSADKARAYLNSLQNKAVSVGRYFKPSSAMTISDSVNHPMFTFVDGDCTLADGSGFLVVTGTLTMNGNTNFKGVILVLGEGVLIRNGGGNGDILGAIMIATFGRSSGDFTSPTFHTNGGGNSNVQYDSAALSQGLAPSTNGSGMREF